MASGRLVVLIQELGCAGGGALTVERALARVPGVKDAYVNPATESACIEYDPENCRLPEVERTIRRTGFSALVRWSRLVAGVNGRRASRPR